MNIYRCGENGNLLERSGGMLVVELHWREIFRILSGQFSVQRYMEFKHPVDGFAYEDKFWVRPLELNDFEQDKQRRMVKVDMDPGGDITLYLNEHAGVDAKPYRINDFGIEEICDYPDGFIERGLKIVRVLGLSALESERKAKEYFSTMWQERAADYL